ncbi:unnamed protein product [Orchesella dallaii]|uniref:SH2 domain-containing protein n=1 Tax=Orchesella dallaii TaxID=48710 RepID=A0ABP1RXB5_9HEXA
MESEPETATKERQERELLEWELSLHSSDLRAHAWYHGNISRSESEGLLQEEGEFLVRDSTSSGRPGDFALSCVWKGAILHFLIQKDVLQPDTIYEQLGYRFENESFPTVSDLITYYVGNSVPISAKSGAKISLPRNRSVPLTNKSKLYSSLEGSEYDYVSLTREAKLMSQSLHSIASDKSGHSDILSQVSLDLRPPAGLLEELEYIPEKILRSDAIKGIQELGPAHKSNFDLSNISSIILPTKMEDCVLSPSVIQTVNTRLLEASDRSIAYHMTKVDWNILSGKNAFDEDEAQVQNEIETDEFKFYDTFFENSQYRWNTVIERSLTLSHFIVVTVLGAEVREELFSKWIRIADELRTSMGNFFSFCSVMRGLNSSSLAKCDGPLDWLKLRRDYTNPTFLFETTLRCTYKGLLQGTEPYPPNSSIPNLLPPAIILENCWELFPGFQNSSAQDKLAITVSHLRSIHRLSRNESIQRRNIERLGADFLIPEDLVLVDIFRTEVHLIILWGLLYSDITLQSRCKQYDD